MSSDCDRFSYLAKGREKLATKRKQHKDNKASRLTGRKRQLSRQQNPTTLQPAKRAKTKTNQHEFYNQMPVHKQKTVS